MAKKKLSKFEAAFDAARKGKKSEFDFGGKKFNTKLKKEGKKSSSKLPKTTDVKPTPRPGMDSKVSSRPTMSPGGFPKAKSAPMKERTAAGSDIAKSKAYIENRGAGSALDKMKAGMGGKKPKQGPNMTRMDKFRRAMKKVSNLEK